MPDLWVLFIILYALQVANTLFAVLVQQLPEIGTTIFNINLSLLKDRSAMLWRTTPHPSICGQNKMDSVGHFLIEKGHEMGAL